MRGGQPPKARARRTAAQSSQGRLPARRLPPRTSGSPSGATPCCMVCAAAGAGARNTHLRGPLAAPPGSAKN